MPEHRPRQRLETGVPGLDVVLCGGLWEGSVTIVQGSPGAGKTILANQMCFAHAGRGERCVYVTLLAESHEQLLTNLRSMSFYDEAQVSESLFYISAFSAVQSEGLKGLLRLLTLERERRQASLIVLDGLFALEDVEDADVDLRRIVSELGMLASITRTTFLLLTNSRRGPGSPEYTMVDGWLELGDVQVEYRNFRYLQVHKSRGSAAVHGRHQTILSDDGMRVYPRLESLPSGFAHAPRRRSARLGTGVTELDAMLGGGLDSAAMTLLGGPTGVGKTSLGLHFIGQSSTREPGLILGFYENQQDLMERGDSLGIDLRSLSEQGALQILWFPPVEVLIDEVAHQLLETVRRHRIRRLLVDGMEAFRQTALYPDRLGRFLTALTNQLRGEGVTTIYTVELSNRATSALPLPIAPVSAVAEYILVLQYAQIDAEMRRSLAIRKARRSSFDPRVRELLLDDQGVRIGDVLPAAAAPPGEAD